MVEASAEVVHAIGPVPGNTDKDNGGESTVNLFQLTRFIIQQRLPGAVVAMALSVLFAPPIFAEGDDDSAGAGEQTIPVLKTGPFSLIATTGSGVGSSKSMPLVLNATGNGFGFDLGGSDTRKLHLFVDSPLSANAIALGIESHMTSLPGSNSLGLDATLDLPLSPSLSLTGDIRRQSEQVRFEPLGSIQCTSGVLSPYSYTASGCRFVDDSLGAVDQGVLSLGARYDTESTSTAISWFSQTSEVSEFGTSHLYSVQNGAALGADLLTPVMSNPLLPGQPIRQPLSYFDGHASGVDLNFQLGLATDSHGDVRFGLALTRVLEADLDGLYSNPSPLGWSISEPFDTAQLSVEWNRGAFSAGVQGFYRDQVDFLNRSSLESFTTFDVHFTWRTPWNADLSLGASNLLNSSGDEGSATENQPTDPFESIYGRIPYVRYKQDL